MCRRIDRLARISRSLYQISQHLVCPLRPHQFTRKKNTMSPSKRDSGYYDGNLEPIAIVGMGIVLSHGIMEKAFQC